jgi:hypothetical protein
MERVHPRDTGKKSGFVCRVEEEIRLARANAPQEQGQRELRAVKEHDAVFAANAGLRQASFLPRHFLN